MEPKSEYKIVSGDKELVDTLLAKLASQGWKPILMSAAAAASGPPIVVVMFEHQLGT